MLYWPSVWHRRVIRWFAKLINTNFTQLYVYVLTEMSGLNVLRSTFEFCVTRILPLHVYRFLLALEWHHCRYLSKLISICISTKSGHSSRFHTLAIDDLDIESQQQSKTWFQHFVLRVPFTWFYTFLSEQP